MTRRRTLTAILAEELTNLVVTGKLKPEEQLPTEAELCVRFDVSRTVVREAVAQLRSDGLLVSRQGRGMFVADYPFASKFELKDDTLNPLEETLSILELRLAIEVESAGLCAERRTAGEAENIRKIMEDVDTPYDDLKDVEVHYDFEFHLAIAQGTKNPYFHRFLKFLEPTFIRGLHLNSLVEEEVKDAYYKTIHAEHVAIVEAIENQETETAMEAMREHLLASLGRLRALSEQTERTGAILSSNYPARSG